MVKTVGVVVLLLAQMGFGIQQADPWKDEKRPPSVSVAIQDDENKQLNEIEEKVRAAQLALDEIKNQQYDLQRELIGKHSPPELGDRQYDCGALVYQGSIWHGFFVYHLVPRECHAV